MSKFEVRVVHELLPQSSAPVLYLTNLVGSPLRRRGFVMMSSSNFTFEFSPMNELPAETESQTDISHIPHPTILPFSPVAYRAWATRLQKLRRLPL